MAELAAQVFGSRPSDVEEMIRLRLKERSSEKGRWPESSRGRVGFASLESGASVTRWLRASAQLTNAMIYFHRK
jgi:hypothetical protein